MSVHAALAAALAVEARKIVASRVVHTTTVLIVVGVAVLASSFTLAADAGNEQALAQLGPSADAQGWDRLVGVASQITAAAGLLGFGVVLSWSVGREFAEGVVVGLFALPTPRSCIVAAKLIVFAAWAAAVAMLLAVFVATLGLVLGTGPLDGSAISALARLAALAVLTGLLAVPTAWAATLGRGLLPGIATAVGMVVLAQIAVVAGTGAWFPIAAPALWATAAASVSPAQLALVAVIPLGFGTLTISAWNRLQLDR